MNTSRENEGLAHGQAGSDDSKLVSDVIAKWRNGNSPDAAAFLKTHPRVGDRKSLVLDLAYEEYCLRKEQGEAVAPSEFCDKFPDQRISLARLLDVHEYLDQHPEAAPHEREIAWPKLGDSFLGFEIERKIGSGAFARVFVARDPSLGNRPVILKIAPTETSEAMTLGRLQHDNIVPVNSVKHDEESGLTAICMPYQGEATLVDVLEAAFKGGQPPHSADVVLAVARRHLGGADESQKPGAPRKRAGRQSYVDAVVALGIRLANALAYAHARGVLHRDLKPSNVLLAPDGQPLLLDFNLSWDNQRSGARLGGTAPYMSPEQVNAVLLGRATGKRGGVDQRSDLFSLGVLLYELLTGVLPFDAGKSAIGISQEAEVLLNQQRMGPQPVEELNPEVDPLLGKLIAACLEFDPAARPPNAEVLETALKHYLQPASRMKRKLKRRQWLIACGLLLLTLIVGALGSWLATRPPYSVRAYQAGLASYDRGDWSDAVRHWSDALRTEGSTPKLHFARAMAYEQLGSHQAAINDLTLARTYSDSGPIRAMLAYCNAMQQRYDLGISYSQIALRSGFKTAAVYNNLGYCYLQSDKFVEAQESLDQAIKRSPRLVDAIHTRAIVGLNRAQKREMLQLLSSLRDIKLAARLAPADWTVQADAARIYAESSKDNAADKGRSMECLKKVVELGGTLKPICQAPQFDHLRGDAEFVEILDRPQPVNVPTPRPRLVIPCTSPILQ